MLYNKLSVFQKFSNNLLGQGSDPGVPQLFTNFQLNKGGIFCREQRENNVSPEFTM